MGVSVQDRPTFSAGSPKRVFEGPDFPASGGFNDRTYDISPDGKRFLMIKASPSPVSADAPRFIVVQNWFEELKRRVPTGN